MNHKSHVAPRLALLGSRRDEVIEEEEPVAAISFRIFWIGFAVTLVSALIFGVLMLFAT